MNPRELWTITFLIVALAVAVALLALSVSEVQDEQASIARYYEDGSGKLQFSNGYCILPAFDSPEDRIECEVTE